MSEQVHLVVLGAERTGSNLLVGLIDSHPKAFVGGELFNPRIVEGGTIPWTSGLLPSDEQELSELRSSDPHEFLRYVLTMTGLEAYSIVGFKLFYYHAVLFPEALRFLQEDAQVRVIHIKRRDRLARLASILRAEDSDVWGVRAGAPVPPAGSVNISPARLVENFEETARRELEFAEALKMHPTQDVYYEDLAKDPLATAAEVMQFLGLDPRHSLEIRYQKTGPRLMKESIQNYDELKTLFMDKYPFFDE